jgi:hypothetical protein
MSLTAEFADVAITDVPQDDVPNYCRACYFCKKEILLYRRVDRIIEDYLRSGEFYCAFCLRHEFDTKKNKDVLILSYRAIIAHLYHACYLCKDPTLYVSQIKDMIDDHVQCGLLNPVFTYDPDTYCWFIDFRRVGELTNRRKVLLDEVINTAHDMLSCFNLYDYIKDFKGHKLSAKFDDALVEFYKRRYRPEGRKSLIPTMATCIEIVTVNTHLAGCATANALKKIPEFRDFLPIHLRIPSRR